MDGIDRAPGLQSEESISHGNGRLQTPLSYAHGEIYGYSYRVAIIQSARLAEEQLWNI